MEPDILRLAPCFQCLFMSQTKKYIKIEDNLLILDRIIAMVYNLPVIVNSGYD